jgi:ubiquinone/menaquinone biosynthesis C-methylase UbiE
MSDDLTRSTWEHAEVERSAREASETKIEELRLGPDEIARYLNAPADAYFPLEYSFYLLGDVRGKVVLDYGSGSGEDTLLLAARGAHVVSMDLSESLIRLAQRRLQVNNISGNVKFLTGSGHNIPLRDESVDVVFGIAILHHLDLALASAEVHRVLRVGGRAIFQEPIRNSALVRGIRKFVPYRGEDVSPYERPLTDKELSEFAKNFVVARERAFYLPHTRLAQILPISRKIVHRFLRTDAKAMSTFPSLMYYAGIKVLELLKR